MSAFAGLAMGASLRPGSGDRSPIQTPALGKDQSKRPLRLGLIISIGSDPDSAMAKVRSLELPTRRYSRMELRKVSTRNSAKRSRSTELKRRPSWWAAPVKKFGIFMKAR